MTGCRYFGEMPFYRHPAGKRSDGMAKLNQDLQHELEERLRFETLLTVISTHFINLPADRIDSEIEVAQGLVCKHLGLDFSVLWQWSDETPQFLILTHLYAPPEGPSRPERINAQESFPWTLQRMIAGRLIAVNTEDLPQEAARDQETKRFYGVKSSVAIPMSVGGGPLIGVLTFNSLQSERSWPDPILKNLKTIGQIFANALARKLGELELRESEARLNMATSSAGVGLWVVELDSGHVWVTPNTRVLFQFAADEILNVDSFFRAIHAEDRDRVHQAVQATIQFGENLIIEYRVILSDGSVRWINARGQRFLGLSGKPLRLMGVSTDISEHKQMEERLRINLEEIEALKKKLEKENIYLRDEIELQNVHEEIVGRSKAMIRILAQVEQVARTDAIVLIEGETGTGKELLARAVHQLSTRKDRLLVTVNCASLPPTLIESELFGREKGAYTGALTRMMGRFEVADRATLFLDEIGELPLDMQVKLLRVLEQGCFERLGSTRTMAVDVRIIAATNLNLAREVAAGRFRKDLYYRLNVFPIVLPPLRERTEDIPALVWSFVREYEKKIGKRVDNISRKCMDGLQRYAWPGNIRELKNVIERAMIVSSGRTLEIHLPAGTFAENSVLNLEETERRLIQSVLQQTGWRLSGQGGAAGILGLKRTTLQSKMRKLGIRRSPQ